MTSNLSIFAPLLSDILFFNVFSTFCQPASELWSLYYPWLLQQRCPKSFQQGLSLLLKLVPSPCTGTDKNNNQRCTADIFKHFLVFEEHAAIILFWKALLPSYIFKRYCYHHTFSKGIAAIIHFWKNQENKPALKFNFTLKSIDTLSASPNIQA